MQLVESLPEGETYKSFDCERKNTGSASENVNIIIKNSLYLNGGTFIITFRIQFEFRVLEYF